MSAIINHTSVERLRGILKDRYGKTLKVQFMIDVTDDSNILQSPSIIGGNLRIPILSRSGTFLASATVNDAFTLSHSECESISSLVSMVLEPLMYDWMLKNYEHRGEATNKSISSINPVGNLISTNIMFLESRNPYLTRRIADEIHSASNRWASLSFEAISNQLFTIHDIISLQNTTIVVEDILNTTEYQRGLICEYLNLNHHQHSPLFLVGSSTSLKDLKSENLISLGLQVHLEKCIIEIERLPRQNPQLRETLELILEPTSSI